MRHNATFDTDKNLIVMFMMNVMEWTHFCIEGE